MNARFAVHSLLITCFVGQGIAVGQELDAPAPLAKVKSFGELVRSPTRSYIVTHGKGGTESEDRFEQLCEQIKESCPQANVYLVDWSDVASGSIFPWAVAKKIEPVAAAATEQLVRMRIAPEKVTFIGESFGNNVNSHIARNLGSVAHILAFNPANELGGGGKLNLQSHAERSWAFHSRSPYDSCAAMGQRGVLLHGPRGADALELHTFGIHWLRQTLADGQVDWLKMQVEIPPAPTGLYDLGILHDGTLDWELAPRRLDFTSDNVDENESSFAPN